MRAAGRFRRRASGWTGSWGSSGKGRQKSEQRPVRANSSRQGAGETGLPNTSTPLLETEDHAAGGALHTHGVRGARGEPGAVQMQDGNGLAAGVFGGRL